MRAGLSGGEYQVVMTVIDSTWGWNKISAPISLKRFEISTELTRQGIIKALKKVEERHIIVCNRNGTQVTEYLFNKHYDTWVTSASKQEFTSDMEKSPVEKDGELVNERLPEPSQPQLTSKEEELVNESSPALSTTVDQTRQPALTSASKQATPATEPTIDSIIDNNIDNIIDKGEERPEDDREKSVTKELARCYEAYVGLMNPNDANRMAEFTEYYVGAGGQLDWIEKGFKKAPASKRRWPYIQAILERFLDEGGPDGRKQGGRRAERAETDQRDTDPLAASRKRGWKVKQSGPDEAGDGDKEG